MSNPQSSAQRRQREQQEQSTSQKANTYFLKQRDLLIQEISNNLSTVVYNLDNLNRSLNDSVQVGKEFDDVGKTWKILYDGVEEMKQMKAQLADFTAEVIGSSSQQKQREEEEQRQSTPERDLQERRVEPSSEFSPVPIPPRQRN